jgi:hypothetical protein
MTDEMKLTAGELYRRELSERESLAAALRRRERTISTFRLLLILAAIGIAFVNLPAALLPILGFVVLVIVHERTIRARRRAENGAAFFERGMKRLEGSWPGTGDRGDEFSDEHHPYAGDFDLFGRGSLFELISIAVTHGGRTRLATWLKEPAVAAGEVLARQAAVQELRENVALRVDLALAASEVTREIESARLDEWAAMPPLQITAAERIATFVLPAATVILLVLALPSLVSRLVGWTHPEAVGRFGSLATFPFWPFLIAIVATAILVRRLSSRIAPVVVAVERAEPAFALLAGVLARVERESFSSERLARLLDSLRGSDAPSSREIARLRKLVALLDARRNQFFIPFAAMLLWTTHVAIAIEQWRIRSGRRAGEWIEAVGEIEALASLASFAFEHPTFAVPEIVPGAPLFEATALGHPLIPADRRVTNDITLGDPLQLLVVSGSNMSGKSTMMRSVGLGVVLAMTGAPVCAGSLRVAPIAVGASIRIHDSLQENASRFFAEILRIRQVLELSRQGPLLFLLDEILAGTNSHDRRIGAEAIVRGLVERNAIGLVSTHDLALAQIAESLAPRAANVHFEDHIEDGNVVFDYRMRSGVVTKSNALALMRSVGIEV